MDVQHGHIEKQMEEGRGSANVVLQKVTESEMDRQKNQSECLKGDWKP